MRPATLLLCLLFALPARAEPEAWTAILFAQLANQRDVMAVVEPETYPSLEACNQMARIGLSTLITRVPPGSFQLISVACFEGEPDEFDGVEAVFPELPTIKHPPKPITIDREELGNTG